MESTYCRLCANLKLLKKMLHLRQHEEKYEEIRLKLQFLQAAFVNMTDDTFPIAVCIVCYDSLNQAYIFLKMIKKAQDVLINKFAEKNIGLNCEMTSKAENEDCLKSATYFEVALCETMEDLEKTKVNLVISSKEETECMLMPNKIVESEEKSKEPLIINFNSCDVTEDLCAKPGINLDIGSQEEKEDSSQSDDAEKSKGESKSSKGCTRKTQLLLPVRNDLHWNNIPWLCFYCDSEFNTLEDLRLHSKVIHDTCAAFKCPYCDIKIHRNYIKIFINHMRKHVKCLRQRCHYCNETFSKFSKLRSHVLEHYEGRSLCLYCGEIFDEERSLKEHLVKYSERQDNPKPQRRRGEPEDISKRTCSVCKKVYKKASHILSHMKHVHSDRKPSFACEVCGKIFHWKEYMKAHIETVHEKSRSFECNICHKTFTQNSHMKKHVKIVHLEEKLFECEVCGKKLSERHHLDQHRLIHTQELPFSCHICDKAFRTKGNMKNHLKQHTGEKPHACQFCSKTFACSGNRKKHLLRIHKTEMLKQSKENSNNSCEEL